MKKTKRIFSYLLFIIGLQWSPVASLPTCFDGEFQCKNLSCINSAWRCDGTDDCKDNSDEEGCTSKKDAARCPSGGHFRCKNNACIPFPALCNGHNDCGDNDDESPSKCTKITCADDEFFCKKSKACIKASYRCDKTNDCGEGDNSDEENCPAPTCDITEFQCANSRCIDSSWRCDGSFDCTDKSDEKDCNVNPCPEGQFKCQHSGHCISSSLKCDGVYNCADKSDEFHCPVPEKCADDELKCKSNGVCYKKKYRCDATNDCLDGSDEKDCDKSDHVCDSLQFRCNTGQCINIHFKCDGEKDCSDNSDEIACLNKCTIDQFRCTNGQCIPKLFRCDGDLHCGDGSDEFKCKKRYARSPDVGTLTQNTTTVSTTTTTQAPVVGHNPCAGQAEEFFCPSAVGTDDQCISKAWLCDGENDCPDGHDESKTTCAAIECAADEFKCTNGRCIEKKFACDTIDDCGDDSDEADQICNPTSAPVTCGKDTYKCKNSNKCIPMSSVCNDIKDCDDEDDEQDLCDVNECKNGNGGCSHGCQDDKLGYTCTCPEGSQLDTNNKTCIDTNECELGWKVHGCSQMCVNLKGSYKCKCQGGYNLDAGGKKCRAEAPLPEIFFADIQDIRSITSNGQHYKKFTSTFQTSAIGIDMVDKKVYWADRQKATISRSSKLSSSRSEVIVKGGLNKVDSLTVDWIGRKLYWVDTGFNNISVSNLDGTYQKTLFAKTGSENYRAVAVHPAKGYLFWTDIGKESKIERSNLDGTQRKTLYTDVNMPTGLTIDTVHDKVYWSDLKLNQICSMNLDGTDHQVILKNIKSPLSIAIFEDFVYWTSKLEKKIYKANKFDGSDAVPFDGSFFAPMDLAIYHSQMQIHTIHPCNENNGGCSHLCLVHTPSSSTCVCPERMIYGDNMKTCVSPPKTSAPVVPGVKTPATTKQPETTTQRPATITKTTNVKTTQGRVQSTTDVTTSTNKPAVFMCPEYSCHSSSKCISNEQLCNGISECPEHDDETNCNKNIDSNTHQAHKKSNVLLIAVLCAVLFIIIFVILAICVYRKKKAKYGERIVYKSKNEIVQCKEHNMSGNEVEIKYVLSESDHHHQPKARANSKNFDNKNFDESKVPLQMEGDDLSNSSDNSSGDVCFDDDLKPIMPHIV